MILLLTGVAHLGLERANSICKVVTRGANTPAPTEPNGAWAQVEDGCQVAGGRGQVRGALAQAARHGVAHQGAHHGLGVLDAAVEHGVDQLGELD